MKIIATSDWHETPFKKDKFKTQKPNWIEKIIIWLTSSQKKLQRIFVRMTEVIREEKIEIVIHNGDLMENPQNEQGLVTREGIQTAKQIRRSFCWENHVHMQINAGNHCLGYRLPLSTDPEGGISLASIKGFQELTGTHGESLCRLFNYKGHSFVFVPFGLVQEFAKDFDIEEFKAIIINDLWNIFQGLGERKIILFLHDPEALANDDLYRVIRRHQNKIRHVFCGHWHAAWSFWSNWLLAKIFNNWWLYPDDLFVRFLLLLLSKSLRISGEVKRSFKRFKDVPARMRELGVTIIPAPLGMLGFGGGFLTLDMETMEIQKFSA
ncbi:MAG: hypothetical protein A2359_00775 [Candidatus Moranbacteria bacterium RIFOXYB1_FULL_43_19]|nr:MAG: hypothetical protein A2184_00175 [Candidatus Moranbacteria bacterium RIFOXYA1_FULL_44_7]OGI27325.1 MAG: hypothetical protein A2359_00775 [Candidatus Moranbacteria bacterium RIFOXYB1_FULL_43_19]OGI33829.1 MAG: hypothetical protein A2420_05415 [Candidatus Moranbacteria bacterium RIFOXYC1_FULL_44_13]OGI38777.1 MAG: hypothetical protein A2612_01075 [Candidatus Moranbacteria bacterium RIFOXYD1_FULL_44_12]